MSICVIGAGINGLATANKIQELEPRAKVSIVADKFTPDTTSDIAAGYWRPIYIEDPRTRLIEEWGRTTFKHMQSLFKDDPVLYGVTRSSGYELYDHQVEVPYWSDIVHNFQKVDLNKLMFEVEGIKDGYSFSTYLLESSTYLPILQKKFENNGGILRKRKLNSLNELTDYHLIVNCSGLGAKSLIDDPKTFPIRGQVITVSNPAIKHFYTWQVGDFDGYILPNNSKLTIGGTHQANDTSLKPDAADRECIWSHMTRLVPILKQSQILSDKVGLRPGRSSIRLECEEKFIGNRNINIIHNYGHGGSGITLFQGCANHAAQLAINKLHNNRAKL